MISPAPLFLPPPKQFYFVPTTADTFYEPPFLQRAKPPSPKLAASALLFRLLRHNPVLHKGV